MALLTASHHQCQVILVAAVVIFVFLFNGGNVNTVVSCSHLQSRSLHMTLTGGRSSSYQPGIIYPSDSIV